MIEIITTIKQVPDTSKIRVDKESGTLIRKGVPAVLNPYCEWAVEAAVSLKEQTPSTITALTMGPPSAEDILIRAMALGADNGILLTDRKFAGSDCRATAYILAQAIKFSAPNADIIITGEEAIDGDTAQVPAELSVFLDMPFIPYVITLESADDGAVTLIHERENRRERIRVKTPFVCSITTGFRTRRLLPLTETIRALSTPITRLSATEIACDEKMIGLKGSPTRVIKIENVVTTRGGKTFHWENRNERKAVIESLV
ncbi:electron transfer flavoprotein subunit beta/FixA family protein [bacterium]|nr:electron transfer flavoprotein subunit beta/FixA family protein [bacterium]